MAKNKAGVRRKLASLGKAAASAFSSAVAEAAYNSDESEDFLSLAGRRENEGEEDEGQSEEEELLMRQMGLEGAEDAADEEDEEEDDADDDDSEEAHSGKEPDHCGSESGDSVFEGAEARTAWGRQAKNFYGESSSGESSEDEETAQERLAEAVRVTEVEDVEGMQESHFGADAKALEGLRKLLDLQGKAGSAAVLEQQILEEKPGQQQQPEGQDSQQLLWKTRLEAEVGAVLEGFAGSAEQQQQRQGLAESGLSEEAVQQLLTTAHPELQQLLIHAKEALVEVKERISPLLRLAQTRKLFTQEGMSLLDTKNQLLLSYLGYLSYYVLLKVHGLPIASHPVVERLIETRLLLQKLQPIQQALKPHLDRLLRTAAEGLEAGARSIRARPEAFTAVGESDEEEPSEEDKGLKYVFSAESDLEEKVSTSEGEDSKEDQKYKPPKMLAVEYTGDKLSARSRAAKELQKAAARLQKSELVRSVREMTGDAPEEIGIERWLAMKSHGEAARISGVGKPRLMEDEDEELEHMKRSLSKKERKTQAVQRALFERRSAAAVGSTLEDLTLFAEQPISLEEDGFDSTAGPLRREKPRGALGHYLNAARQAADENAKIRKANAEKLILARQQNLSRPIKRGKDTGRDKSASRKRRDELEGDEEFEELAAMAREKKAEKKKRMQEKAKQFLPQLEEEVRGQRGVTREIAKNRGLTRKRKKFEGNARVHNRIKFAEKTKKLKSMCPDIRPVEDRSYEGEATGIRANLKKSRTLR
ncbi:hypothetical protein Esti_005878 [Eimeria stiedai]